MSSGAGCTLAGPAPCSFPPASLLSTPDPRSSLCSVFVLQWIQGRLLWWETELLFLKPTETRDLSPVPNLPDRAVCRPMALVAGQQNLASER